MNLSSLNDQDGHVGKVMSIPGVLWKMVIALQIQLPWGSNIGGDARWLMINKTALMTKLIEAQIALTEKVMVLLEKR